jgi:hypothetical protein
MIEKIDKNEIYDLRSTVNLLTAKINEIIEHLNNQKQSINSLYGNTVQDNSLYEKYYERNQIIDILETERLKYIEEGKEAITQEQKIHYRELIAELGRLEFLF